MNTTPSWEAAKAGPPGHLDSTNHANQVDQLLGTHGITPIYEGNRIVTPNGGTQFIWFPSENNVDWAQPFTMPSGSTTVGRVTIPLQPIGQGSDVLVTLCPDNGSGAPNTSTPLASTVVPASWIIALAAVDGLAAGGPIATTRTNTMYGTGSIQPAPWAAPAGDSTGTIAQSASVTVSGNYLIMAGGETTAPVTGVNTVQFLGPGIMSGVMAQPSLPQATNFGGLVTTPGTIACIGGAGSGGIPTSAVWTASWDPNTGQVGSWSSQTALPTATAAAAVASSGSTVYVIGGVNSAINVVSTVYFTTVNNSQISGWQTGPSLPQALSFSAAAVIGSWLIVAGGTATSPVSSATSAVYYAQINSDGSLGSWQTGPSLPQAMYCYTSGWDCAVTDSAMVLVGGFTASGAVTTNAIQVLTVGPSGLADQWYSSQWRESGVEMMSSFEIGNGQWALVNTNIPTAEVFSTTVTPVPEISVPLHATGLTSGSTYYVVLQQHQALSTADYTNYAVLDASPLPSPAQYSFRHTGTWSVFSSIQGIPISVYDASSSGQVLHTWEDPSSTGSTYTSNLAARTSTIVYNAEKLPIGVLESTVQPNDPLNSNPTFTSGTSPWTAHNGTIAQSSAQTHGGFAFSGLLTPAGGSATASVTSELVPIRAVYPLWQNAQWYQVNGWVYSPTGWSSVSLSIDWYDATSTYISTSSNVVSVAATTWTNLVNTFQPPTNAAYASINVTESGTPGTSNTLYLSNVVIIKSPELTNTVAPVTEITYSGTWPPIGTTQLA